jgi:hypothetical protein
LGDRPVEHWKNRCLGRWVERLSHRAARRAVTTEVQNEEAPLSAGSSADDHERR